MAAIVDIEAHYDWDADALFAEALNFGELAEAMRGFAVYDGLPNGAAQEGETYTVDVTIWGVFKNTGHVIHVERVDRLGRILQSREYNPGVRRWDHTLSIQPKDCGAVWSDRVVVDAGWRTWALARFVAYVYLRRHRRRNAASIDRRIERAPR